MRLPSDGGTGDGGGGHCCRYAMLGALFFCAPLLTALLPRLSDAKRKKL